MNKSVSKIAIIAITACASTAGDFHQASSKAQVPAFITESEAPVLSAWDACVGLDCQTNLFTEPFEGFDDSTNPPTIIYGPKPSQGDTLQLKENNLRILFDHTPAIKDGNKIGYEVIFNDSKNGGNNYFAINHVIYTGSFFNKGGHPTETCITPDQIASYPPGWPLPDLPSCDDVPKTPITFTETPLLKLCNDNGCDEKLPNLSNSGVTTETPSINEIAITQNTQNISINTASIEESTSSANTNTIHITKNRNAIRRNSLAIRKNTKNIKNSEENLHNLGEAAAGAFSLAAALTTLPTESISAPLTCGLGTGTYTQKVSLSLGCAVNLNQRTSLNIGGAHLFHNSTNYGNGSLDNFAARLGVAFNMGEMLYTKSERLIRLNQRLEEAQKKRKELLARLARLEANKN